MPAGYDGSTTDNAYATADSLMPGRDPKLPLAADFQSYLLLELCQDRGFALNVLPHLKPKYFENPIEAWAAEAIAAYRAKYEVPPSLPILVEHTRSLPPAERDNYAHHLAQLGVWPPLATDGKRWLRDQVMTFVRQQFFRAAMDHATRLHNDHGRTDEAQAHMIEQMARLRNLNYQVADRSFFFEEFESRVRQRRELDRARAIISTGLPTLDHILNGGLAKGRLGIWVAYAKGGKSTMLTNLAVAACRQFARTIYFVYEGSRAEVEDRCDAAFGAVSHLAVNRGEIPDDIAAKLRFEYSQLSDCLIIRGFTTAEENAWNCSVSTIVDELQVLKQTRNWEPDCIIVDYGDLLTGRDKFYKSTVDRQTAVYQDLKVLANRGYAVWTASQPQRPEEDAEIKPHVIRSRQIADCYAKVRIADFIGSINSTLTERDAKVARIYAELYRSNEADQEWVVRADFATMTIREEPGLISPHRDMGDSVKAPKSLGYEDKDKKRNGLSQSRAF